MTKSLVLTLSSLLGLLVVFVSVPVSAHVSLPARLAANSVSYVESSSGLIPPEMEGGRTEVEMGDVNADGNLDLVSIGDHGSPYVNTDEHGVMVWFGDGTGLWNVHQTGNFGYGGVALGDANRDGVIDVGYGMHHNYSGTDLGDQLLEVALGDGTGQNWIPWDDGLASNGEDWGMFGTDFADVNHDGHLDIGSISFGCCAGVHVYLNQADGTWQQSFGILGGNSDMHFVFGDVNGDGNPDIAVSHQSGTVYLGDGHGNFVLDEGNLPPLEPYATRPGVSLGDVDHDGRADLGFCTPGGGVAVWRWAAPGAWENLSGSLPVSGPYEATQLFDMDMDGHRDMVAFGEGQLRVWRGDGSGGWTETAAFSTPSPGYLSAFRVGGDADHNGYPDIVIVAEEGVWPSDQNHARFYKESSTPTGLEIKPVFPSGHETLLPGGVVFIDWISAVPDLGSATVQLELSLDGTDGPWALLADELPDSGRFQWHLAPGLAYSEAAYLRYTLVLTPEVAVSLSPAPFTVLGIPDDAIIGLAATSSSPTPLGEPTTLTATVESGTNVDYEWMLGDGSSGDGAQVTHWYEAVGFYPAVVTASNSVSLVTATTSVTIADAPIVGLQASNDSPTIVGDTTELTATIVSGSHVSYTWAFGDGELGVGDHSSHVYPTVGSFVAAVTATNRVSDQSVTTTVSIVDALIEGLAARNDSPTALGNGTVLTASIKSGTNVSFAWSLGDSGTMQGPTIVYTYGQAGTYDAIVTATNSTNWLTATTRVTVTQPSQFLYLPLILHQR